MTGRRLILVVPAFALLAPTIVAEEGERAVRSLDFEPGAYVWTEESMQDHRSWSVSNGTGGGNVVFLLIALVLCLGIAAWVIGELSGQRPARRLRRRVVRRDDHYYY
ncbi:MAG: hypothetical protein H0W72_17435 [Planctomycetes bacterium]|nr:hypothetical protein [Planctomycetota bacterium]